MKKEIENKIAQLEKDKLQLEANYNAVIGAINVLKQLLHEADKKNELVESHVN